MLRSPLRLILAAAFLSLAGGCAGYADRIAAMHRALDAGDVDRALVEVNKAMGVASAKEVPAKLEGDVPVLLLERGTLLHARGDYELSERDWQLADEELEVLDIADPTAGKIAQFLYSDDAKHYVAPPHEKLMLNTLNMLNYLVQGDLRGARVEARRFTVSRDHLRESMGEDTARTPLGSYLAGVTFEWSGRPREALRYYAQALGDRQPVGPLWDPVRRLVRHTGWAPAPLDEAMEGLEPPPELPEGSGEVVVVVEAGRVPHRVARRIPIGLALTWVASDTAANSMDPETRARAQSLAAQGLVTWVNFPELADGSQRIERVDVRIGGQVHSAPLLADVAQRARLWYERQRPLLVGSAITRLVTRVLAGLAVEKASRAAGASKGLAKLFSLATQGTMVALDTPDTRTWSTLPARYFVFRRPVPAGSWTIVVRAPGIGATAQRTVEVSSGGFAVISLTWFQ